NFGGYIEGNEVFFGKADVVVCDGFNGNIALKLGEGLIQRLKSTLSEEVSKSIMAKAGILLLAPTVKKLLARFSYEKYGGTPLLGVKGAVLKAHGRSKSNAIVSAISAARKYIAEDGTAQINREI
ncbi:MAG: phosphate acyltransferase PlsX, partial [Synergistaceae bacterium]|nr:phosphate acyltransferase PlsX [Synergistaceae bacterium]